jgi:pimeloyl-ACP methyl ester carboxylesterase
MSESVPAPFTATTDPAVLAELRSRLRATRWPDAPEDAGWSLGTDLGYLRELVDYWIDGFDWEAAETGLGLLPRFTTTIGDARIHFVHARAIDATAPVPLVLCHGWPDSFWRYSKVIPLLVDPAAHGADPADAFDVVVPDMPGYGFSPALAAGAIDSIAVAGLWSTLMTSLGYDRFGAVGGDIGSHVARYLALDHPDRVTAVHRMDAGVPRHDGELADLAPDEQDFLARADEWGSVEGAYGAMHRTKPQTAAFGLTDSPVGLAAWIVEKMRAWSDCGGDIETAFTKDEILTNVTLYWLTGTIGSSMRMYNANAAIPAWQLSRRVEVPSGFALYPGDIVSPPRAWLDRVAAVARVSQPGRGGHFAPFEDPEGYARELRDFFRPFRTTTGWTTGPDPVASPRSAPAS